MRGFYTTSDTRRHKIGNTSGGERKVCTLNAKGTAGRRRPKRSRQKSSAITLRISRLTIRQSASPTKRKECATTE